MKQLFSIAIPCLLAIINFSCQHAAPLAPIAVPTDSTLLVYYDQAPVGLLEEEVDYSALLTADPHTGQAVLGIRIRNRSQQVLEIPYQQWQLETPDGLRSSASYTEEYPTKIAQGESATYMLDYQPTNSRKLSMMLEKQGDFKQRYQVELLPWSKKIELSLTDSLYQSYLAKHGEDEKLQIYFPKASKEWLSSQEEYLKKLFPKQSIFVHALDNEWNIQGVVIKVLAYSLGDSIHIGYRIANQAEPHLRVLPDGFQLQINGDVIQTDTPPAFLRKNKPALDGKGLAVLKSERFQANYSYPIPKEYLNRIQLALGIQWYEEGKALLHQPIIIEPVSEKYRKP